MRDLYTHTFRNIVRLAAESSSTKICGSWTDYRNRKGRDEERIVTYCFIHNEACFIDKLGKLMELAGTNAQSHGMRVTNGGYLKCNCLKPTMVKFN